MTAARSVSPPVAPPWTHLAPAEDRSGAGPAAPAPAPASASATAAPASVRPAPQREPAFDDAGDDVAVDEGQSAGAVSSGRARTAVVHPARPALRLVGAQDMLPMSVGLAVPSPHRLFGSDLGDFAARPSGRGELPDPLRFSRTFVQALLEVLSARRPVAQLAGHTSPGLQAGLTRDQARGSRLDPSGRTPVLHSLRISEPADGVSEWCAVIRTGRRYRAIAGRLEGLDGRWRCTRLQIG